MKKNALSRFESIAQSLFEEKLARFFGGPFEPLDISMQLLKAVRNYDELGYSAAEYEIGLNSEDLQTLLEAHPHLDEDIVTITRELGSSTGIDLLHFSKVHLSGSASLPKRSIQISPHDSAEELQGRTKSFSREKTNNGQQQDAVQDADGFLIINGRRHFQIDKDLVTIGRHPDNDIVLHSRTVSRFHAQLRWRLGHFTLYDIGNRGRTKVNGAPVVEHVLKSGDIISISDTPLIFGQGWVDRDNADRGAGENAGNTQVFRSKSQ